MAHIYHYVCICLHIAKCESFVWQSFNAFPLTVSQYAGLTSSDNICIGFYRNLFDFHVGASCCGCLLSIYLPLSALMKKEELHLSPCYLYLLFVSSSLYERWSVYQWIKIYLIEIGYQIQFGPIDNYQGKLNGLPQRSIDRTTRLT